MMMVRSYLAPSAIEGLGVFSVSDIRKGSLVWLYNPDFDVRYLADEIARQPKHFREYMERYTYPDPEDRDFVVLDCDEGRFMNHADQPNVDLSDAKRGVATCDIPAGVELTCDYRQFMGADVTMQPPRNRVGGPRLSVA